MTASYENTSLFVAAMRAAGIQPLEPITDRLAAGELVRFRAEGDKPGHKSGWARLFADGAQAGVFGHWRLGISTSWRPDGSIRALSDAERRQIAKHVRKQEAERRQMQEGTARQAASDWGNASLADPAHAYLQAKQLAPFGIRQYGQTLLIPMWDAMFRLRNLQRIPPNGKDKRFMPGGQTNGLFWHHGVLTAINQPGAGPLIIAEGFATAAAIHEATGYAVVAAMSGKNLEAVAGIMRNRFPSREIIVAADYDGNRPHNVGVAWATRAAEAAAAKIALPLAIASDGHFTGCNVDFADISRTNAAALIEAARNTKAKPHE